MILNLLPEPAAGAALVAGCSIPVWLMLLSHGPWKVAPPGKRFVLSALLAVISWLLSLQLWRPVGIADFLVGAMILFTAVLAGFTIWTLIAWGFTLSMLRSLSEASRLLTLPEWITSYTGGKTIDAFGRDRLGVLFRLEFADRPEPELVQATVRGMLMGRLAAMLRKFFGVPA